ncbi:MAG TPA: DUF294 nucleotidyltransferase-like domain-containing protein [Casimicrobiaceae bacterium]|nr:DUF294 nucleotidyltransferase-like domain-containing protein [Casimicrobiaceae bacterium]
MSLVDTTIETLRPHAPFDRLRPDALRWLAERLALAFHAKQQVIVSPARGVVDRLYIVKQGHVRGEAPVLRNDAALHVPLGPGECFPVGALMGRRATAYEYVAGTDAFVYELSAQHFRQLLDKSPEFERFCAEYLAAMVEDSQRQLRAELADAVTDEGRLAAPLRQLVRRAPVTCGPTTPIATVLATMHRERVGSMVVVDDESRPIGILTQPDVLERVALARRSLQDAVSMVMTPHPIVIDDDAPAYDGALVMAQHGIRHLLLVEGGRLTGVVSERDLYAMQRSSPRRAAERIRHAENVDALAAAAQEAHALAHSLLAQGMGAEQLTRVLTALNDTIVRRALGLAAMRHRIDEPWCWIALGSEGRREQTLVTDQDNGLIVPPLANKAAYLAFADEVNLTLDRCGFPLCKGNIMARNPQWCLTLDEWKAAFLSWIRNPVPEALLNAAIFFDVRGIGGDTTRGDDLAAWLAPQCAASPAFLRALASNALAVEPPVGLFHDLFGDDDTIDLKQLGIRPFVEAARIWALSKGLPVTGTAERLRAASNAHLVPAREADAFVEAFHYLQAIRLRAGANHVAVDTLNPLDRRILKEAFRQAASAQQRLRLDFGL